MGERAARRGTLTTGREARGGSKDGGQSAGFEDAVPLKGGYPGCNAAEKSTRAIRVRAGALRLRCVLDGVTAILEMAVMAIVMPVVVPGMVPGVVPGVVLGVIRDVGGRRSRCMRSMPSILGMRVMGTRSNAKGIHGPHEEEQECPPKSEERMSQTLHQDRGFPLRGFGAGA